MWVVSLKNNKNDKICLANIWQVDARGDLLILGLTDKQTGSYTCIAENNLGHIESRPALIQLQCKFLNQPFDQGLAVGSGDRAEPGFRAENLRAGQGGPNADPCFW